MPPAMPPRALDAGVIEAFAQCAHDLRGEIAGLADQLRMIPGDQIGLQARPLIDAALLRTEAMDRMIHGTLVQLSGAAPAPVTQAPFAQGGLLAARRVLIADDTLITLRHLASLLSAEGARVIMARSGAEAVELLGREDFDLLVTDATMEGMPGAQVIRALRARPGAGADTPALAMTSDTTAQLHDELIAAGASRVVTKPLPDPAEMLRIVVRLMKTRTALATAPPAPSDDLPLFDPGPLTRVCGLAGPAVGREILDRLMLDLIETLARLDRVSPGQRGGGTADADMFELRATTHVLIALAGTAGAPLLLRKVQALDYRLQHDAPSGLPADLAVQLADIRMLTRGAVAAIARMPLPGPDTGAVR